MQKWFLQSGHFSIILALLQHLAFTAKWKVAGRVDFVCFSSSKKIYEYNLNLKSICSLILFVADSKAVNVITLLANCESGCSPEVLVLHCNVEWMQKLQVTRLVDLLNVMKNTTQKKNPLSWTFWAGEQFPLATDVKVFMLLGLINRGQSFQSRGGLAAAVAIAAQREVLVQAGPYIRKEHSKFRSQGWNINFFRGVSETICPGLNIAHRFTKCNDLVKPGHRICFNCRDSRY